jgi:hypothetical protein
LSVREIVRGDRRFVLFTNDEPSEPHLALSRARNACTCGGVAHGATCRYWDMLPKPRRPHGIDQVRVLMGFPPCTG